MIQVVYSSDPQLAQIALSKIVKSTFGEELTPLNSVTLDMGQDSFSTLVEECLSLPIGCSKKAVIVKNCFFLLPPMRGKNALKIKKDDTDEAFLSYLENPDPSIYLYMAAYGGSLDNKGKYARLFASLGIKPSSVNEFTLEDWKRFVPAFFAKKGIKIEDEASSMLIERLALDYGRFLSERNKLVSYASGSGYLSLEDIKALVAPPLEEKSYALTNALTKGDAKEAFHIYKDLKIQGYDEVALLIQSANQFRKMNMVSYLLSQRMREEDIASALSSSYKMSVYQVRAISLNLRRMKKEAPLRALEEIYKAEKAIFSGEMDAPLAFTIFLSRFPL